MNNWQARQLDKQKIQDDLKYKNWADRYINIPKHKVTANNPAEILPSTFEGLETAQVDEWKIDEQDYAGGYDGVKIKVTTRVVYNESGDQVLYGFYRELTFDSLGRLAEISAETRYNIDTPEEC